MFCNVANFASSIRATVLAFATIPQFSQSAASVASGGGPGGLPRALAGQRQRVGRRVNYVRLKGHQRCANPAPLKPPRRHSHDGHLSFKSGGKYGLDAVRWCAGRMHRCSLHVLTVTRPPPDLQEARRAPRGEDQCAKRASHVQAFRRRGCHRLLAGRNAARRGVQTAGGVATFCLPRRPPL